MRLLKCVALSLLFFIQGAHAHDGIREFSVVVEKPEFEYSVDVGGAMDPENIEIAIENLGDTLVVNPRMTVN
jgi:hypothetical protein